jgi:hypothetical protein
MLYVVHQSLIVPSEESHLRLAGLLMSILISPHKFPRSPKISVQCADRKFRQFSLIFFAPLRLESLNSLLAKPTNAIKAEAVVGV